MDNEALRLAELTLELVTHQNAAGEYSGNHPEFKDEIPEHLLASLARKVIQYEEMRLWGI